MTSNVIAIDGPAASGKSTVAKRLAEKLGRIHISTGDMYRAITLAGLRRGIILNPPDESRVADLLASIQLEYKLASDGGFELILDGAPAGDAIRGDDISNLVSHIARLSIVRSWLLGRQRELASKGGLVMEGRDIGTVVFPDAKRKFFLTATPEVRAIRRLRQNGGEPTPAETARVAAELAERDRIDSTREVAPLRKAEDAVIVDSSGMTVESVVNHIASMCG